MSTQRTKEDGIELVETGNIARSLVRLRKAFANYSTEQPQRRAIYHALCMTNTLNTEERGAVRVAMKLP